MSLHLSEIIKNQATFIVGTTGHVMHGKSTLVRFLTGKSTQRHQSEIDGNKSINLGYANCKIWRRSDGTIVASDSGGPSDQLLAHISFADCPGHEEYMSAMINGTSVMDHALVVVAGNESIPKSQTVEHIKALDYGGITSRTYVLNKLDLLMEEKASTAYTDLVKFLEGTKDEKTPIIPVSAKTGANIPYVISDLLSNESLHRETFLKKTHGPVRFNIVRSYNINKPGATLKEMKGAVVGGTLTSGVLAVGDYVEIRPGVIYMNDGVKCVRPLYAQVKNLRSEETSIKVAVPGGLIGVGLTLYAGLSGANRLAGQVMGHPGTLPDMYDVLCGKFTMIDDTTKFVVGHVVQLVANGVMIVPATIVQCKKNKIEFKTSSPVVLDGVRCAIMISNKLVAHFEFTVGELTLPIFKTEVPQFTPATYTVINDLPTASSYIPSYSEMASKLVYRTSKGPKIATYVPQITPINKSSYITKEQWDAMITSMTHGNGGVDLGEIIRSNMEREFSNSKPHFDQHGSLIICFRMNSGQLSGFLGKFQSSLMVCPSCRSTRTVLQKGLKRHCINCASTTYVHSFSI